MKLKNLIAGGLVLFGLLSCLDMCLTFLVILRSGGQIQEGNPVAREWLLAFGWPGLVIFKIGTMVVAMTTVILISRRRPTTALMVVILCCMILAWVVKYSYRLLANLP
jgi:hypothetical protein